MIYVLEDDRSIRELVVYSLSGAGLDAEGFALPSEFRKALKTTIPDLVLLDIMLPEEDGIAILHSLRKNPATHEIPIIMLTALGDEFDKVQGLDAGADDYVVKPFGIMELLARIRARLRRRNTKKQILSYGSLEMDQEQHEVRMSGHAIDLTLKEYELLLLFLQHPQRVFDREQLLERIWGYEYPVETRTVDVHIRTLRQKLGSASTCIETVRGVGYRLAADQSENDA